MGTIKALLVGVCEYITIKCPPLPLCKMNLYAMRTALIHGLNINSDNILLCGETGIVTKNELVTQYILYLRVQQKKTHSFLLLRSWWEKLLSIK